MFDVYDATTIRGLAEKDEEIKNRSNQTDIADMLS
jgi:hypothetical protein